ncbi:TetR/AcrR family transcriptional regulator [Pantoea sp. LMR881]|uniref:TetR/AcrR family transcriptional regulator n=1 Tax=Pantoea sp. LMR881 TaxID=3014336 RepID=UPI0022B04AE1|nr:TetR/AcrR family transcriptional regulator [Pantoea sp. LMR881]MCZ4060877.1 TetR/AcrR family transcriptional regulator [Pantoea sp. LMR881]
MLLRDGIAGLGLRAIAREAGVSHTAPRHHFGDLSNLLSELTKTGYRTLKQTLLSAVSEVVDPVQRRKTLAKTYITWAYENPQMFGLMFRNEIIDAKNPGLIQAMRETMAVLSGSLEREETAERPAQSLSQQKAMRIVINWSLIHGMATLLIDNRLTALANNAEYSDAFALICATLDALQLNIAFKEPE